MQVELDMVARAIYIARGAGEPRRGWRAWEDLDDAARDVWRRCAHAALVAADGVPAQRYRHKKRGTTYTLIGVARIQSDVPLTDMDQVTVYRCEESGYLWSRRRAEFEDGRFERLPSSQTPVEAGVGVNDVAALMALGSRHSARDPALEEIADIADRLREKFPLEASRILILLEKFNVRPPARLWEVRGQHVDGRLGRNWVAVTNERALLVPDRRKRRIATE
jgi:hypothetical protein